MSNTKKAQKYLPAAQAGAPFRGLVTRRRKIAAVAIALVVIELAAAGAVAITGREWIDAALAQAQSDGGRAPAVGLNGSLSTPSIAAF